jgi:hypothetical protein
VTSRLGTENENLFLQCVICVLAWRNSCSSIASPLPFEKAKWTALYRPFSLAVWLLLPLAVLLISLTNHAVLTLRRSPGEPESSLVTSLLHTLAILLINRTALEQRLKDFLASRVS